MSIANSMLDSQMAGKTQRRIAYVMTRFPKMTETFILGEMMELEQLGWHVDGFALVREHEGMRQPGAADFMPRMHFGVTQPASMLRANFSQLLRHPSRYFRLLARTMCYFWRSPRFLARSLICFPVAVYWASIAQQHHVAHLHAHFATHATYMAYIMSELTGLGYSFTAHAHDIYTDRAMLDEKIRRAQFVVTISHYNRGLLLKVCPQAMDKIHVVYCGIDTELFRPHGATYARAPTAKGIRLLTVARLQEYKGVLYLVEACKRLKEQDIRFHCTIVGDGPDRREIEAAMMRYGLRDHIALVGWRPSSEVASLLADADVFVLPSVVAANGMMDGIPNVLMEAMSCAVPVVSTTISGIPELVTHGVSGLLVPPRDATRLATALAYLAAHPAVREQMGLAGRMRIIEAFTLHTNVRVKAALFDWALAPDSASPRLSAAPL